MGHHRRIIAIPPTTAYTVIFPFDAAGKRYDCGFYSPGLTDGRASAREINQVLAEIEATRASMASKIVRLVCLWILFIFVTVGLFVAGLLSTVGGSPGLIPFVVVGFFVLVILASYFMIKGLQKNSNEMKKKCQAVCEKHNEEGFAARGLRWHIPVMFPRWIELWKDYQSQQPGYILPVSQQPYLNNDLYVPPNQV